MGGQGGARWFNARVCNRGDRVGRDGSTQGFAIGGTGWGEMVQRKGAEAQGRKGEADRFAFCGLASLG